MHKFDTKVQHLKYRVLREVARHAWGDTLMESVMDRMDFHLRHRPVGSMTVGAVTFSNVYGILGRTEAADWLLEMIRKEY